MKRWWIRLVVLFLVWWSVPFTPDVFDAQSAALNRTITIQASGAQTAAGNGSGVDISSCLSGPAGTSGYQVGAVIVTAGSGTVTTFKVWFEASADGVNWSTVPAWNGRSITATTFTANTELMVSETALQTSGLGMGYFSIPLANVRARWNIVGTTPSETFSVVVQCYS